MNAHAAGRNGQRWIWSCCAFLACALSVAPAWSACPKLLMTAGLNIHKQTNPQQAAYWGETVGAQGFMINYVVTDWQTDVGTNPDSGTWKLLRRFQSMYAQHGVTDNFIKIGLYRGHDWHDAGANRKVTRNLAHAAALARYAGLKGLALDLEPYKPTWGGSAGGPELAELVEDEGRKMGQAMHDAYPDMTLFVLPDVMRETEHEKKASSDWASTHHGGYQLSTAFVRGLLSVPWSHVVIGTEFTYSAHAERIVPYMKEAADRYRDVLPHDEQTGSFSIAPGLWPLGPTAKDKSARFSPKEFRRRLQVAFDRSQQYVWIYGSGSAWQKDGPFGPVPGPVATSFQQFLDVIHQVRARCSAPHPSAAHAKPHGSG